MRISRSELLRKSIHLSLVLVIALHLWFGDLVAGFVALLCIGYLISELTRHSSPSLPTHRIIEACLRSNEGYVLTPALLLASIATLLLFFEPWASYPAIIAATLGDALASLVGQAFGRNRIWGKSVEGSTTLFFITFLGSLLFVDAKLALLVSSIATLIELSSRDWDNLLVPLGVAICVKLLTPII